MTEPIIFPDYHGSSIANLMQTLASARGGDVGLYPPLEGLDAQPLAEARTVVMLVIDGLGITRRRPYGPGLTVNCSLALPGLLPPVTGVRL